ncbi:ribonuclease H-like domain-containing protein, partial [Candidatus Bathyarchaeota archaeon]|nr:ribonuclease H-like domain-containing protein [Candidatus Bathyarchaeota archaeon]
MDKGFFQRFSGAGPPMTMKDFYEGVLGSASIKNMLSFDIETFSPTGFPYNAEDPVVNYSLVAPLERGGLFAVSAIGLPEAEVNLLRLLRGLFEAFEGFYLLTYNGVKFDLEYVVKRGRLYGLDFMDALRRHEHIDVYQLLRWLGVRLPSYSQKSVEKVLGIKRAVENVSGGNYHIA